MDFFLKCLAAFTFSLVVDFISVAEIVSAYGKKAIEDSGFAVRLLADKSQSKMVLWSSIAMAGLSLIGGTLFTGSIWAAMLIAWVASKAARVAIWKVYKLERAP